MFAFALAVAAAVLCGNQGSAKLDLGAALRSRVAAVVLKANDDLQRAASTAETQACKAGSAGCGSVVKSGDSVTAMYAEQPEQHSAPPSEIQLSDKQQLEYASDYTRLLHSSTRTLFALLSNVLFQTCTPHISTHIFPPTPTNTILTPSLSPSL